MQIRTEQNCTKKCNWGQGKIAQKNAIGDRAKLHENMQLRTDLTKKIKIGAENKLHINE